MPFSNYTGVIGILFVVGICYVFSTNRRAIDWRTIIWGLVLQIVFALLIIRGESIAHLFDFLPITHGTLLAIVLLQLLAIYTILKFRKIWTSKLSVVWIKRVVLFELTIYVLKFNLVGVLFDALKTGATQLLNFSTVGATFVFGV
ncbi:MAG TPA: Na+ dependent nucleoside transporter N-terminal domain-containing protein [Turneriella sp.]|nr:Na+ dependent nucleoside transporter N-terminal domain-containing protein [Turneriella sp.]